MQCGYDRQSNTLREPSSTASDDEASEKPPPWYRVATRGIVAEIAVFSIGIGLILLVVGVVLVRHLNPRTPPLPFGMPRQATLAGLALVLAAVNIAAGVATLRLRQVLAVYFCICGAILIPVGWLGFMVLAAGVPSCDIVSILAVIIAVVVARRGSQAVAELKGR